MDKLSFDLTDTQKRDAVQGAAREMNLEITPVGTSGTKFDVNIRNSQEAYDLGLRTERWTHDRGESKLTR
jgi:hypothetical protein